MARIIARSALALALVCSASQLLAQDAVLTQLYGSGVHHFFAGHMDQATQDLSAAINGGTKDPRAYYFRALAEMRSGDTYAATADLQVAAALESADVNLVYPVGKALERVQGAQRMQIERYRAGARAQAHERQLRRDQIRYEERRRAEADVLRNPKLSPPPKAPIPAPKPGLTPADEDLFGEEPKADEPADAEAPKDDADPFADDAPADEPAAEGMPAEDPSAEQPAAEEPAADEPAAPPKAEADPFEGDEKPAAEKPAAEMPE